MATSSIFIANGVAQYPFSTPFIGQKHILDKLQAEMQNYLSAGNTPNIMLMRGTWGSGKSRLGFEVCAQLLGTSKGWLTEKGGSAHMLLPKEDADRYMPLFLRYIDVLHHGTHPTNVLPLCLLTALDQVVHASAHESSRERLQRDCQRRLREKGIQLEELSHVLGTITPANAVALAKQVTQWLHEHHIERILLVIDEVESAGEVPLEELPEDMQEDHRHKARRDDIDTLAQGCKEIANENVTPGVDYLFLASDASSVRFASGALQSARITTIDFQPVTFDQIDILRDSYKEGHLTFPERLEEAAFFVANRNFRWYNWLMFRLHASYIRQPVQVHWQLFEREAKNLSGPTEIFNLNELEAFLTGQTDVDHTLKQVIFSMLPTPESVLHQTTRQIIEQQPAISLLLGVQLHSFELGRELLAKNFSGFGNQWERGGVTIDIARLLSAFQLFGSIEGEFFLYKDQKEFEQQVMLLYPEIDDVTICRDLFQIFFAYHTKQDGSRAVGPAIDLLVHLNRQWKTPKESAFLSNPEKNARLQNIRERHLTPQTRNQHLATGLAHLMFEGRWKGQDKIGREQIKLGSGILAALSELPLTTKMPDPWSVSPFQVVPILVVDADMVLLVKDLKTLRAKIGLAPVILLFLDRTRYEQMEQEDKAFQEGNIYPRELLIPIDLPIDRADYLVCLQFGYAEEIGFQFNDVFPGRWLHRCQSLKKRIQEEWEKHFNIVRDFGWLLHPVSPKTGREAEKLIAFVEAVVLGENRESLQRRDREEITEAKRHYDEVRAALEPIFDGQDQLVLTASQFHLLRRMRDEADVSQASPLLREVLYQGYQRTPATEALKQNLEYLRVRGIVAFNEETQKYQVETPVRLKALLDAGEQIIQEYKLLRDDLKSFYEGTLNSFHMQDTDIDPLLSQLQDDRQVLREQYQGDLTAWDARQIDEYTAFCSKCRKTLAQISDPSAERAYPIISVEVINRALPLLTTRTLALEGNVAHRIRFLIQYQKAYEEQRALIVIKTKQRLEEIKTVLKPVHGAFPWQIIEQTLALIIEDLDGPEAEDMFSLQATDLADQSDDYVHFPLRKLITEFRLSEAYARLMRYHKHLLDGNEGIWQRTIRMVTQLEKQVQSAVQNVQKQWQELDRYLQDAGSDRRFLEANEEGYERIQQAAVSLPLKAGTKGLAAIDAALETLERAVMELETHLTRERDRLDRELLESIPDLKGLRIVLKLAEKARARNLFLTIERPEQIAHQRELLYQEKKKKIAGIVQHIDQRGWEIICKFTGAYQEDWDIYKKVVSALYQEKKGGEYDFGKELSDGIVDERNLTRLRDIGVLDAEKRWNIEL